MLYWFTEEDGELCLGTEPHALAKIVFATGITAFIPINRKATSLELGVIGDIASAKIEDIQKIAGDFVN